MSLRQVDWQRSRSFYGTEVFDAREPYRFVAHGKRNKRRGTQRFRGPAVDRRSLVEGIIGANRFQRLNVNRGFFRMTGLVATGMLLAITLIGHNLVRLHAWHTVGGGHEPWQVHLGEPVDDRPLDKATRTRRRRKRPGD